MAAALPIFALIKYGYWSATQSWQILAVFVSGALILASGSRRSWRSLALKRLGFPLGCVMAAYLVLGLGGTALPSQSNAWLLAISAAAVVAAAIGWNRPAAGAIPALGVLAYKRIAELETGIKISATDYLPVLEISLMIGLLATTSHWLAQRKLVHASSAGESVWLLLLVALHFGNYFWSAVAKIMLDGPVLAWVYENQTYNLLLAAWSAGLLPIAQWPDLSASLAGSLKAFLLASNVAVFAIQLFAVVALLRVRWAICVTLLYDASHIAIFLASGILFWKWILLNLFIVVALAPLRGVRLSTSLKLSLVLAMLLGHVLFFTARLGWYDTASFVSNEVVAVTRDGQEIPVPPNWFLAHSVTFAQGRVGPSGPGHAATGTLGSVYRHSEMREGNDCQVVETRPAHDWIDKQRLHDYLRNHHRYMVARADSRGGVRFHLYPHHIVANPLEFAEFNALDKRLISGYRLRTETRCLTLEGTAMTERILHRTEVDLPL